MNFDTPSQALTICGEWSKIFEDTRHKRQAAPECLFARCVRGRCKIKAAGGISTVEDMEKFLDLGADRLGTSRAVKLLTAE